MSISIVEQHPFISSANDPHSTVSAMGRVRYSNQYDLGNNYVYDVSVLARVWIVREPSSFHQDKTDFGLFVYPVLDDERSATSDEIRARAPIGVLRPAQGYVTTSGIARARAISDVIVDVADDPWGCVLVESAGRRIWITPPIVERLHSVDREIAESRPEFIVCDGNHRIVERAWRRGLPTASVVTLESPAEPYYILPMPASAWKLVSDNELPAPPPREERYTVRQVESPRPDSPLHQTPPGERYRRYFRSLETGFGNIGGQAGSFE